MAVARRQFFGGGPTDFNANGGRNTQPRQPNMPMGGGGGPAAPPPPTDPSMVSQPSQFGRGPTMPGNVDDLLQPQQDGGQQDQGNNPMAGSSSIVLRLLQQLGKI